MHEGTEIQNDHLWSESYIYFQKIMLLQCNYTNNYQENANISQKTSKFNLVNCAKVAFLPTEIQVNMKFTEIHCIIFTFNKNLW